MKVIFKRDYRLIDADHFHDKPDRPVELQQPHNVTITPVCQRYYSVPAGEYEAELMPNPMGFGGVWLVLKNTRIGASLGSLTQWAGEAWGKSEVIVLDDDGKQVIDPEQGYYTLEMLRDKIVSGEINHPDVVARYNHLAAAKDPNHQPVYGRYEGVVGIKTKAPGVE
jgi:hypothetical protein